MWKDYLDRFTLVAILILIFHVIGVASLLSHIVRSLS